MDVAPQIVGGSVVDDARRNMLQERLAARQQQLAEQHQRLQEPQEVPEYKGYEPPVLIEVESDQYHDSPDPDARRNQLQQRLAARQQQMQQRKAARTPAPDKAQARDKEQNEQKEAYFGDVKAQERVDDDADNEAEAESRRQQLQQRLAARQQQQNPRVSAPKESKAPFKPADMSQRMPSRSLHLNSALDPHSVGSRRSTPRADPKTLEELFERYCDGQTMDVAQFCKFARKYGLLPSVFDIKEMRVPPPCSDRRSDHFGWLSGDLWAVFVQ